jgi:hypothetical protein
MDSDALWTELFDDPQALGYRNGFVDRGKNQINPTRFNAELGDDGEWEPNPDYVVADDPSLQKDLLRFGCLRELLRLLNTKDRGAVAQNVLVEGREVVELLLDNQAEWDALGAAIKENVKLLVNASGGVNFNATNRARFETVLASSPGLLAGVQALYTLAQSRAQELGAASITKTDLRKAYEYATALDSGDPKYLVREG